METHPILIDYIYFLFLVIEPRFQGQNAKVLRKRFPKEIKEQVLSAFENGIINEDTGKTILMSGKDFHEHMKFSEQDTIDGLLQLEAIVALPELMRTAKLVESYDDKKNVLEIKKMHRFQGALRIGDKDYSVKLTVKEHGKDFQNLLTIAKTCNKYIHPNIYVDILYANDRDTREKKLRELLEANLFMLVESYKLFLEKFNQNIQPCLKCRGCYGYQQCDECYKNEYYKFFNCIDSQLLIESYPGPSYFHN